MKFMLPLKRLMLSIPLNEYEPAGVPGARPAGVVASVMLCADATELVITIISGSNKSARDRTGEIENDVREAVKVNWDPIIPSLQKLRC